MDFIYSRYRIKFPKLFIINKGKIPNANNKNKNYIFILIIVLIGVIFILNAVTPVFNELCVNKAKTIATLIANEEVIKVVKDYTYSDFIIIHKDNSGKVLMLESNMININNVISNLAANIQKRINNTKDEDIRISIGTFTGINILSGRGYSIPIRISTIGNIETNISSEFISKGINQTLHRLYLNIECNVSILNPFNTITESIINQFIIAENIIVGEIPNSYYNLDGITTDNVTGIIE